ncbi:MAG: hypothetical protein QUT30_00205 [Acidobacteriota bacterium]|nr:hypothetical protein [Acidobacteriota bacterium]
MSTTRSEHSGGPPCVPARAPASSITETQQHAAGETTGLHLFSLSRYVRAGTLSFAALLLAASRPFPIPAGAQQECCTREVYTAPFSVPAGENQGWSRFFSSGVGSPLHGKLAGIECPPLEVSLTGNTLSHDYRFVGEVETEGVAQRDPQGRLMGNWVARVRLIDLDHGNAVLREARPVSWTGSITDGLSHKIYNYDPSTDSLTPSWVDRTGELGKQFGDLGQLIHQYERRPTSCLVEPEKETIRAGETATIYLREIRAAGGSPPQPWQRIIVRVEKGRILDAPKRAQGNGEEAVFEAKNGTVQFRYKAPEECDDLTETITVFNSCTKRSKDAVPLEHTTRDEQIASKELKVRVSLPESLSIELEKTRVRPDENMLVQLRDIVDKEGKRPEPTTEILVEVNQGKLIAGDKKGRSLYVPVGEGSAALTYQAPPECRKATERLTVKNRCVKRTHIEQIIYRIIGERTFDVECLRWTVTVDLHLSSPFVPEPGLMTIADLAMRVVFDDVGFESWPADDPLGGCCAVDSDEGTGSFTRFVLNDTLDEEGARHRPRFIKGPPKEFDATLMVSTDEEAMRNPRTGKTHSPPEKVRMLFWTSMGLMATHWGGPIGSATLEDFKLEFEAPWRDLISGRPVTLKIPYEGDRDETGMWTITFTPRRGN